MSLLYTLKNEGYLSFSLNLPSHWEELVTRENYERLYREALDATKEEGFLYQNLKPLLKEVFQDKSFSWELMLAKREGPQDEEDEGIWHDDASRSLALSLSLNPEPKEIEGGCLLLRTKSSTGEIKKIETQNWGTLLAFATGKWGWDHKITRVTSGNRLVLVAWVSENP